MLQIEVEEEEEETVLGAEVNAKNQIQNLFLRFMRSHQNAREFLFP